MMYKIVVDMRESALISGLQAAGASDVAVRNLAVGDVQIEDADGLPICIVERKTLLDLASSLNDGRYKEQAHRISSSGLPADRVFYLIEGRLDLYKPVRYGRPITIDTLRAVICSLQTSKGFGVHLASTTDESVAWLQALRKQLSKRSDAGPKTYADVAHHTPSAMVTRSNIEAIMLSCIPGLSAQAASDLLGNTGGLRALLQKIRTDPDSLIGIKLSTGSKRAISKTVIRRVCELLA